MNILNKDYNYRLELHWESLLYEDNICKLTNAFFSGPVLKIANKINEDDWIMVDMTNQFLVFVPHFYLAKLQWKKVSYDQDGCRVFLHDAFMSSNNLNLLPKFKYSDFVIINTSNHEQQQHRFNFNYESYLVNYQGELYKF